jgi:RimJ/RimL family protein N-acetyltransferase
MRRLITNDRARVGAWVAERVGRDTPWTTEAALGLEKDGELVAGIVIDGYVPNARGSMHCAIDKRGMNKEFLYACFDYAFNFLNLKVLLNPVSESNKASMRFTEHIGFKEISRIPEAWDGNETLVLYQLRRDECRHINS